MAKFDFNTYIENNTIRLEASHRGGGIEIDATGFTILVAIGYLQPYRLANLIS